MLRIPTHLALLVMCFTAVGCGLSRGAGRDVLIDGVVILPEGIDGESVQARLSYDQPKYYTTRRLYSSYNSWSGNRSVYALGNNPSEHVSIEFPAKQGRISMRLEREMFRAAEVRLLVKGEGIKPTWVQFDVYGSRLEDASVPLQFKGFQIVIKPESQADQASPQMPDSYRISPGDPSVVVKTR